MSRREARESDSKRHRSRFDREPPSPKRSRRDDKPATEKSSGNIDGTRNHSDRDRKPHSQPQDAPVETQAAPDSKVETQVIKKESDRKNIAPHEGTKHSSDVAEAPRSKSYFQHDERGNAGRSFSRGAATERGWWRDSEDRYRERTTNRTETSDMRQRTEKSQAARDEGGAWRHDGFFKMEADPQPPVRKRPSFREKKIHVDSENAEKAGAEPVKQSHPDRPVFETGRRDERGGHNSRQSDRLVKPFADREANRGDAQRSGFSLRDRYGGNGNYRGRERFNGRRPYRPGGVRVEKWKHDLYDEANRSPTPKNEEDQIAKVEALLSS